MSPHRLILLALPLLSALAAGSAIAGGGEAPVSIGLIDGVSSVTGVSDFCSEPTCSTLADSNGNTGDSTLNAAQSHSVVLDPDEQTLLVATASGSIEVRDIAPGVPDAATAAFSLELVTTVPVLLEVTGGVSAEDGANGSLGVQGTHIDGGHIVAASGFETGTDGPFSAVIPAGDIRIGALIRTHQVSQNGGLGEASFSLTVTITRAPGEIRWVNAAGGSWNDAENWDPAQVPGPEDSTVFDLAATYDVTFGAAAAPSSRGTFETCASPNSARSTRIRAGALTYTGVVDVSTLSDSVADPGLRVGGASDSDTAELTLESGELCSLFSSVGDTDVLRTATVHVLGGTWTNPGRLRVGDRGEGLVRIDGGAVVAGETRLGRNRGGTIEVTGVGSELDTGALLLAEPGAIGQTTVRVSEGASLRSDAALVGGEPAVCLDEFGSQTDIPCAIDQDCAALGAIAFCQRKHQLIIETQGTWTAFDPVRVGGGTIVADDGTVLPAPGNGALRIGLGVSNVSVPELELGVDTVTANDRPDDVSRGVAVVLGQLDVLGPLRVGAGGAGVLEILPPGQVTVTGTTLVGGGFGKPLLREDDPFVPGPFRHGTLRAIGPAAGALFSAPRLTVRPRGVVELDDARIEVAERMFVFGGQLTGVGTVATPDFEVSATGRLGPVFPVVVNRSASPRGASAPGGLVIEGNLTMGSDGIVSIAATGPGVCGRVSVTGAATLGGTLEIAFVDGYLPAAGDSCDVFSVDGVTVGEFERVSVAGVAEGFAYEAIPSGAGGLAFRVLSDATACQRGDEDGDGFADCERCGDCLDDDFDGLVDRADPDCAAPADGMGAGLGDPAFARCHGALVAAGKLVATKTLKTLQKCADAMQKCRQQKPDDPRCTEKVAAKCEKAAAKLAGSKAPGAKAEAKIVKACSALSIDALLDPAGLGYEAERAACAAVGIPDLASAADVAACTVRRQQCRASEWFGSLVPRAGELLADAGIAGAVSCLPTLADGAGAGLGDPKGAGKRAFACQKAVGKAGAKLLASALDAEGRCTGATLECVQTRPGDAACLTKAASTCEKEDARLARAEAKLAATFEKKCGEPADLLSSAGLGFGFEAATERCLALGTMPPESGETIAACLVAESLCRARQIGDAATPRAEELIQQLDE